MTSAKLRVLVHDAEPAPLVGILRHRHPDIAITSCSTYAGLAAAISAAQADVVYTVRFAGTAGFPRSALVDGNVHWVAVGGSGTDHLAPWDPTRVVVTNAAGVAAGMMSQFVIGAMLHFALDVPGLERDRKARHWCARKMVPLDGRVLLVVGLGRTGRAIAQRAKSFGMEVLGIRANPRPTPFVDEVAHDSDLLELLPRADFTVISVPLTPKTRGMFNVHAFGAMKKGAHLIDISRGGVVQQAALVEAIESGRLAGAALDVFETEPLPMDSVLWSLENLLISPHCSSVYEGWELNSMHLFCDNLERWRQGRTLDNVVDPVRGY